MKKWKKTLPEGTRDMLFSDCAVKKDIAEKLKFTLESRGYSEVETPSFEFYDVFSAFGEPVALESLYKLTDAKGRLMVLRPECTMPIARVVSTKLRDTVFPLKLCYCQNVFNANESLTGKKDEITQVGAELIGISSIKADIEIISSAINSLKNAGFERFSIELGHVGVFKSLMNWVDFSEEDAESVRNAIETKNFASLSDILQNYSCDSAKVIKCLPELFGSDETFKKARELCQNIDAVSAINYLEELYQKLCALGFKEYLSIDFGLVHHINYYTGIVFRGYVDGSGEAAITGGRYDDLLSSFSMPMPATGFAINVNAISEIVSKNSQLEKLMPVEVLIFNQNCSPILSEDYLQKYADKGVKAEISLFETYDESVLYATKKGIKKLVVIDSTKCREESL